jgi:hypothetical protein
MAAPPVAVDLMAADQDGLTVESWFHKFLLEFVAEPPAALDGVEAASTQPHTLTPVSAGARTTGRRRSPLPPPPPPLPGVHRRHPGHGGPRVHHPVCRLHASARLQRGASPGRGGGVLPVRRGAGKWWGGGRGCLRLLCSRRRAGWHRGAHGRIATSRLHVAVGAVVRGGGVVVCVCNVPAVVRSGSAPLAAASRPQSSPLLLRWWVGRSGCWFAVCR